MKPSEECRDQPGAIVITLSDVRARGMCGNAIHAFRHLFGDELVIPDKDTARKLAVEHGEHFDWYDDGSNFFAEELHEEFEEARDVAERQYRHAIEPAARAYEAAIAPAREAYERACRDALPALDEKTAPAKATYTKTVAIAFADILMKDARLRTPRRRRRRWWVFGKRR